MVSRESVVAFGGAVVAAPDYNTPGGSYYYHWERDGALSNTIVGLG